MASNAWDTFRFQDVIDFQEGPGILAKDFCSSGIPLIRLSGLTTGANLLEGCDYLDPTLVEQRWSHFKVREGDTLLSTSASLGRTAVVDASSVGAIPYTGIIRMRPLNNRLMSEFIRFLLQSPAFQQQVEAMGVGSVIRHFGPSHLRQMTVTLPPLPEQRTIVGILGALDDKIELNRRMNQTLEQMAQALFRSWFVDFDPVRAKMEGRQPAGMDAETAALFPDTLEDSALGPIPQGWHVGKLGEVMTSPRRGVDPTTVDGDTPYIGLEHMPRGSIALSDWGRAAEVESTKLGFRQGEILFGKLRPYFHKVGVAPVNGVASSDIIIISSTPDWFGFVLGHVSSAAFVEYTNGVSTGTRMPRASWSDMAKFPVVLPPPDLAKRLTAQINPLIQSIHARIKEHRPLTITRDALLPKLLSGEVRVAATLKMTETKALA